MDYVIRCMIKFWKSANPNLDYDISTKETLVAVFGMLALLGIVVLFGWIYKKYFK